MFCHGPLSLKECCCVQQQAGDEITFVAGALGVPIDQLAPGDRATLCVPQDFSLRSVNSAATSSSAYVSLSESQKNIEMAKLQRMIRDFVVDFLQGVFLDAVLEDGSLVPCRCIMSSTLSVLMLQVQSDTKTINIGSIQEICSGREAHGREIQTPVDDLCVTLVMSDDRCVSFKFTNLQAREHFATCMKVLRLALE
mmetsp:Transcript_75941/g.214771  ORF Transcript_75941/g.214771 Transcript_75941/m.214771 type:complete len:196 (-) Transcript_75941:144-731(-)